ncbi:MAG: type II secretion system protein GspG [Acidobacteria bacterium]|nr:type II secretion system protein GspG [Acidobacteriota bacterium]
MLHSLLLIAFALSACTSARLSNDEARKRIAAIGRSSLIPDAIQIQRIVSQTETQAIAESTVALAFQFTRDNANAEWKIAAVRLGDRDWIDMDELRAAIDEGRRRSTAASMQKLADGIANYRTRNGSLPGARDIITLTNVLHPAYMTDLVREDGWGQPIAYEVTGAAFRLVSNGADGRPGTPDDVVIQSGSAAP